MSFFLLAQRQRELGSAQAQLTSAQNRRRRIEDDINEVRRLRERMTDARDRLRTQRTSLGNFASTAFPQWRGDLRSRQFRRIAVSELTNRDFRQVITRVERTIGELGRKRTSLQSDLSEVSGTI